MDKLPIIVVIGTTGVGKTKLAIQIANKIKGQIVNADSMQVYKGLDIITNKPTENEKGKIKHLLFDFVDPIKEYSVVDYLKDAVKTITQIHKENCIPIIVGGTNYYIQSLLWENITIEGSQNCTISSKYTGLESCHKSLLNKTELIKRLSHLLDGTNPIQHSVLEINEFITNNDLHSSLFEIDPIMAERWHINDYRKIRRSIEIYYTTGKCHSEFLKSQKETVSKLRYRPLVFWLYGSTVELNKRLDSRVDKMISQGLFKEMSDFHKFMRNGTNVVAGNKNNIPDYTRGILQSIGFKEFHNYLHTDTDHPDSTKFKNEGIERMKISTRQYATQQVTWLKNKLCRNILTEHESNNGAIYILDATYLDNWDTEISACALPLSECFMNNLPNSDTLCHSTSTLGHLITSSITQDETEWKKHTCETCLDSNNAPKTFNGDYEWKTHMKSRKHWKTITSLKNRELNAPYIKAKRLNDFK